MGFQLHGKALASRWLASKENVIRDAYLGRWIVAMLMQKGSKIYGIVLGLANVVFDRGLRHGVLVWPDC